MKTSRKLAAALAVFAAGSIFFGNLPANAAGIEADGAKITASRHHGHMPPPEYHHHHHRHMPPPEYHRHHIHGPHPEHFGPHGHRHMPPPEHHHHRR